MQVRVSHVSGLALLLLAVMAGCPARPPGPATATGATAAAARASDADVGAWRRDAETRFAGRADEAELRAAIAGFARVAAARPGDDAAWLRLARARLLLADGFLVFGKEAGDATVAAEHLATLRGAADAALAGLRARSPELRRLLDQGVPLVDASAVLAAPDAIYLYFWAEAQLRWATSSGAAATMQHFGATLQVMERVAALDAGVWYGGPDRFFGVVYAAAPAIVGGDLARSRRHFEASLARAPDFLDTRVLYAQFWAGAAGDTARRTELLGAVVAAPEGTLPEVAPEQTIARRKARALLAQPGR